MTSSYLPFETATIAVLHRALTRLVQRVRDRRVDTLRRGSDRRRRRGRLVAGQPRGHRLQVPLNPGIPLRQLMHLTGALSDHRQGLDRHHQLIIAWPAVEPRAAALADSSIPAVRRIVTGAMAGRSWWIRRWTAAPRASMSAARASSPGTVSVRRLHAAKVPDASRATCAQAAVLPSVGDTGSAAIRWFTSASSRARSRHASSFIAGAGSASG